MLKGLFSFLGALSAGIAYAANTNPTIQLPDPLMGSGFADIAERIIDGVTTLAIPVVGIMVVWGGLQIITAGGEPEKFKTGRQTILYAVIGFAVILLAKGIVLIVQNLLIGPPATPSP